MADILGSLALASQQRRQSGGGFGSGGFDPYRMQLEEERIKHLQQQEQGGTQTTTLPELSTLRNPSPGEVAGKLGDYRQNMVNPPEGQTELAQQPVKDQTLAPAMTGPQKNVLTSQGEMAKSAIDQQNPKYALDMVMKKAEVDYQNGTLPKELVPWFEKFHKLNPQEPNVSPSSERDLNAEADRLGLQGKERFDWKNQQRISVSQGKKTPQDEAVISDQQDKSYQRILNDAKSRASLETGQKFGKGIMSMGADGSIQLNLAGNPEALKYFQTRMDELATQRLNTNPTLAKKFSYLHQQYPQSSSGQISSPQSPDRMLGEGKQAPVSSDVTQSFPPPEQYKGKFMKGTGPNAGQNYVSDGTAWHPVNASGR